MAEINLFKDDYTTLAWPEGKLHSEDFPYLVVRVGFGVYSLIPIPDEFIAEGEQYLIDTYGDFPQRFGYQACLVMGENRCFYFKPDGSITPHHKPPLGGSIINWIKFRKGIIRDIGGTSDRRIFVAPDPGKNEKLQKLIF
ncbi:hypothetical protein HYT01_02525 [Candidatus Giovannonibacteria bacterium]|nr:hypothetical protein [Candidatus Giovannonibacteria bacterium]